MYTPDPFKNYVPKGNPPKPPEEKKQAALPSNPLTEREKQKLATMSAKELISLLYRCNANYVRAALMTEEERAEAALDKLTAALLAADENTEIKDLVTLCREVLDRMRGKPGQTIMQTNVNVDVMALRKEFSKMSLETLDQIERLMIEGVAKEL